MTYHLHIAANKSYFAYSESISKSLADERLSENGVRFINLDTKEAQHIGEVLWLLNYAEIEGDWSDFRNQHSVGTTANGGIEVFSQEKGEALTRDEEKHAANGWPIMAFGKNTKEYKTALISWLLKEAFA